MTSVSAALQSAVSIGRAHRRNALILMVVAGLGIAAGLATLRGDVDETSFSDNWQLTAPPAVRLASDINTILSEPLFGGEPVVVVPDRPDESVDAESGGDPWTLMGLVFEGSDRFAVIRNDTTTKLQYVATGNSLPGGETLVEIRANSILYQTPDDILELALFRDVKNLEE